MTYTFKSLNELAQYFRSKADLLTKKVTNADHKLSIVYMPKRVHTTILQTFWKILRLFQNSGPPAAIR